MDLCTIALLLLLIGIGVMCVILLGLQIKNPPNDIAIGYRPLNNPKKDSAIVIIKKLKGQDDG